MLVLDRVAGNIAIRWPSFTFGKPTVCNYFPLGNPLRNTQDRNDDKLLVIIQSYISLLWPYGLIWNNETRTTCQVQVRKKWYSNDQRPLKVKSHSIQLVFLGNLELPFREIQFGLHNFVLVGFFENNITTLCLGLTRLMTALIHNNSSISLSSYWSHAVRLEVIQ